MLCHAILFLCGVSLLTQSRASFSVQRPSFIPNLGHMNSGTETGSSSSASFFFSHCHSICPLYSPFIQSIICHWCCVVLAVDGSIDLLKESTAWTSKNYWGNLGRQWDWESGSLIKLKLLKSNQVNELASGSVIGLKMEAAKSELRNR